MDQRRRASDLRHERDRLLAAWLERKGYGPYDWMRMSSEELAGHRRQAEASSIQIPRTEDGYLYHGTSVARATRIKTEGLATDKPGIWHRTGYGLHIRGRVFLCDTIQKAHFYATEMSRTRPALLRIPTVALMDRRPDLQEEDGCYFVERPVPADDIEIWSRKGWRACPAAEPVRRIESEEGPGPA